jgi:hypothetical protein
LILSRKGFDSSFGGCPSPIFADGSMVSLPIPGKSSPIKYQDVAFGPRRLGDVVMRLPRSTPCMACGAHLDPDLRRDALPRLPGWRPSLGQINQAQSHLANQGVGEGDLFVFFGLFQKVDAELRWTGKPMHVIWGWMQIGQVASVDEEIRPHPAAWAWLGRHPHLEFGPRKTNTLYVAAERLTLPGVRSSADPAGTFDAFDAARVLSDPSRRGVATWLLPRGFEPRDRPPLTFHRKPDLWEPAEDKVRLRTMRGQEFVLDLDLYPELVPWLARLLDARKR